MFRRLQHFGGAAREWYQTNVLATGAPVDSEKIEFARANDYYDEQNYQTYGQDYNECTTGDSNINGNYHGGFGEYEEFSEGVATQHKISEWQAGWNVTNAIQGMFVVSFPYTVLKGGYWAIISMVFFAYICCHTGKILVDCLYEPNLDGIPQRIRGSYMDIAAAVWGAKWGRPVVTAAQLIELLMTCILYIVLCGDLMEGSFPDAAIGANGWMIMSAVILLSCAFLRNLQSVSFTSFWCTVAHIIINMIILTYCLICIKDWHWSDVQFKIDIYSFPIALGIVVFSYTSQIFLPTLEGNMTKPNRFNAMLNWSHLAAAVFKALFAYVGFLTWGLDTQEEITNNLPTQGFKAIVNLCLVIKALLSYPLPFYAACDTLEHCLFRGKPDTPFPSCRNPDGSYKKWGIGFKMGIVFTTLIMAIAIPHFTTLMGFIGNFTGTMLSFIWPCYFHMRLKWETLEWYIISLNAFIICLGLICGCVGMYYSAYELIRAFNGEDISYKPLPIIGNYTG
ncbi:vesicular inhibitory amino acid transporter-like [Paramacrobiotus metropolitanus]|uniref:vesicular inhibitory amino acid transporter-like n=1 Tax=Paramacrobiotus metropolitanus TaxID=2943436 RepID=UPI0024463AB1|nr:vesicular inhibitory amino acid transporter-like [Paramacrobiotus metropolitanus]